VILSTSVASVGLFVYSSFCSSYAMSTGLWAYARVIIGASPRRLYTCACIKHSEPEPVELVSFPRHSDLVSSADTCLRFLELKMNTKAPWFIRETVRSLQTCCASSDCVVYGVVDCVVCALSSGRW